MKSVAPELLESVRVPQLFSNIFLPLDRPTTVEIFLLFM
jgi:hypothetical protein